MGLQRSNIDANLKQMPGVLDTIGKAAGLPGPLPWPSGFMTYPNVIDNSASWSLVEPEGPLPLVLESGFDHPDDADRLSSLTAQPVTYASLIYRGPDSLIHGLGSSARGRWEVGSLSATLDAPAAAGDPCGYVDARGVQHVAYRGTDNLIHDLWRSLDDDGWQSGTLSAAQDATQALGDPCAYAEASAVQRVIYRGGDGLHELYQVGPDDGRVGGLSTSRDPAAGDPSCYVEASGVQHVIYRGSDSYLHEVYRLASGLWLVGSIKDVSEVAAGDPSCYVEANGVQHVVYMVGSEIHELYRLTAVGWLLGMHSAPPGAQPAAGNPYGFMDAGGAQHVVYRGTDDLIHDLMWSPSTGWKVGTASSTLGAAAAAGDPWAYVDSAGQHVVYRGQDALLHELTWAQGIAPKQSVWQIGTLSPAPGVAAAAGDPSGYLLAIAPPLAPQTLLDVVALQSWNAAAVGAAVGTFSPRGSIINDPARPDQTPSPEAELYGAAAYLAGRHSANFAQLLGGALDITSHRIDSWATALATARLAEIRTAEKVANATPVTWVGGFGWVENLKGRLPLLAANPPVIDEPKALDDPANSGFMQAPSLQQATTAAVLRSGYLTHNPPTGAAPSPTAQFAIDLSSRRARLAGWILDGIRQGQSLSSLLGYRFERAMQEAQLGTLIDPFRRVAPYEPAAQTGGANVPAEAVRASDVVDGVALLRLFQALQSATPPPDPMEGLGFPHRSAWTQAQGPLAELQETADAIGDATLAQAVHDSLSGGTHAAAATFDAIATGVVPAPELRFLSTPRSGIAIAHRVLVPAPTGAPYPPAGWPDTPRGRCGPALTALGATLLGAPSPTTAERNPGEPGGAALPGQPVSITLAQLGLGPLDVLALARRPSELELLALSAALARRSVGDPPAGGGILGDTPAGAARPLSAVMAVARLANQLIGTSRAADARDLAPSGVQVDPGFDVPELAARVNGPIGVMAALAASASALGAALPGDPPPGSGQPIPTGVPPGADPATLTAALLTAVMLGVPDAAPAGPGAPFLPALVGQARAARSEIARRQDAITTLEPPQLPLSPTPSDYATTLAARMAHLTMGFGQSLRALPRILANNLAQAAALTQVDTTDPGQGPDAWLAKAGRVHQAVADLLDTCCADEALGGPAFGLTVAQVPSTGPAPWVAQAFVGAPPPANTLSLAIVGPTAPAAGTLAALLVADWVEVIPSAQETTGLTYHYDAPSAQAPQTVLLAVPSRPQPTSWTYSDLIETVGTALDLSHARSVELNDLQWQMRQVLPAAYLANQTDATPAIPGWRPPGNYLNQEAYPPFVQSAGPASFVQGQVAGSISITGTNLDALTPAAVGVDGDGVTITGLSVAVGGTAATVNVAVSSSAGVGPRGVHVGSQSFPSAVTITAIPQG